MLSGVWELHPTTPVPLHPSPHRLTQCLLNIVLQKVLLHCVCTCSCTYSATIPFMFDRFSGDFCVCMSVCICMKKVHMCLWKSASGHFISYVSSLNLRQGEQYVGPLSYPLPWISERYCLSYCCWKAPSVPGAVIYVPDPLHLQLLSIRLYNIPPIVQLPALSALPRPVSRTCPTHNHTGSSERGEGAVGGVDRTEPEIEEVGYNR